MSQPGTDAAERRIPLWLAIVSAGLVGVATALQARVNGSLGGAIQDGYGAAFISFGSGLVILVVVCAALPGTRAALRRLVRGIRTGQVPWWALLGGLGGALTTATQGLTVATVGVALFTVGVVAGQTLNGLVLDRVGYGPGGAVAVTLPRVGGAALALAGVVVCASGAGSTAWWMLVLPFLAGAGIAWQQGTNGILGQRIGNPLAATFVNFLGGTLALGIATAVHVGLAGPPAPLPGEWWMYVGGAIGVAYIALSVAIVRVTGVLLLGLGSVVGLLASSVVFDALWPAPSGPALAVAMIAVVIALAGVTVAVVPWRRRRRL